MGGVIDIRALQRSTSPVERRSEEADPDVAAAAALRDRARLLETAAACCPPAGCGSCTARQPCAAHQLIDTVLEVIPEAEAYLLVALGRRDQDRSALASLTAVTRALATIDTAAELIAAIPRLALSVARGAAAALIELGPDGAVATLARGGAPFDAPAWRVAETAREALGGATGNGRGGQAPDAERSVRLGGRLALVPLEQGLEGLVLVLEREASEASACPDERDVERLALFGALASAALVGARARAALREASARDSATLGAIREGVIAVDREGVVRALNQAGAAALAVRRDDLIGRPLSEVPGLAELATALSAPDSQVTDRVALPHGEVSLRSRAYEGGVVATLREVAVEHAPAQRRVGSTARYTFEHLIGASPEFLRVVEEADRAARCDVPVLICGESGTGKEMLAQAIHNASPRARATFLGVNVTAIPRELLESELFGYEGGAFTGARSSGRAGKFELAGGGTLLLDEIGDMPIEMQGKLLRVLQERTVQRLGGARDISVPARIIATTHRDLGEAVEQGRFRLDLYHRLRVLELRLPALRQRPGDVQMLVAHQLRRHAQRTGRRVGLAPQVMAALQAHDWPGNVRELENVIEAELSVLAPGEDQLTRIPPALPQPRTPPRPATPGAPEIVPLAELERQACLGALAACQGNVARAARALGVAKGTLYCMMKRHGIEPHPTSHRFPRPRGAGEPLAP